MRLEGALDDEQNGYCNCSPSGNKDTDPTGAEITPLELCGDPERQRGGSDGLEGVHPAAVVLQTNM